jgi:hypothetical protein
VQETPDEIPEGETPNSVTIYAFEGLTDVIRPGDRIEVRLTYYFCEVYIQGYTLPARSLAPISELALKAKVTGIWLQVTGIVRASPARVHHRMRSVRYVIDPLAQCFIH